MDDKLKIWTTVGSAGILNQADLAKVTLHGSIIQLRWPATNFTTVLSSATWAT